MEEFNRKHGIDFVRVPFKGGGDAVNSMMTGTTPIAIFGIGNLIQFIRDGKILGLAVDGDKRSPLAPDIPTFREIGYTRHLAATFFGIYAPTGTPQADHRQVPGRRRQGRLQSRIPEAPHDCARADRRAQHARGIRQAARPGARRRA